MTDITLHPDSQSEPSVFNGNKGLLIAVSIALLVGIIGLSAFLALDADKYQGLIQQVENQTQQLKNR